MKKPFHSVMVIDDNHIDLYVSARIITKTGFAESILQFSSAREALNYLRQNDNNADALPDVIFVDIYMPEMSGFEFMAAYDKLPDALKTHCRVYITSSSLDENDIARANSDPNVIAFHEKPVSVDFLEKISA